MSLREWWSRMLAQHQAFSSPAPMSPQATPDDDAVKQRQLDAIRKLREMEGRMRALQVEADILRGDRGV